MIILPKNIFSLKDWKNANILNNFLVWYLDFEREKEFSKSLLSERRKAYEVATADDNHTKRIRND